MKKSKKIIIFIFITIILIAIAVFFFFRGGNIAPATEEIKSLNVEFTEQELNSSWEDSSSVNIVFNNTSVTTTSSTNVTTENAVATITKSGTYVISGETQNGQLIVDATSNDDVKLVLNNIDLTCTNSAPIFVKQANEVIITLADGTTNNITDGEAYELDEEEEPDAAIFSKDVLVVNGTGTLNITSNYKDGIASKDNLKIVSGNINIESNDDGIRGKDFIAIKAGTINITANGDGIKSTNADTQEVGYIVIENGNITIDAVQDGIQAESNLNIKDGNIEIITGGGSENSSSTNEDWGQWDKNSIQDFRNMPSGGGMQKGGQKGNMTMPGEVPELENNTTGNGSYKSLSNVNINQQATISNSTEETTSAKGLKATTNITIENGNITLNTSDDSLHSNGTISITNGNIDITSGDDGIHADANLYISSGKINITKSYEGLESAVITIDNGEINVIASDDGINVAGGNDGSSMNGRAGQNNMKMTEENNSSQNLTINNGNVYINSSGDGIDINGSGYINGGTVLVDGPTNSGNGALDYAGSLEVNGGLLIAAGSTGMMQTASNSSKINCLSIIFNSSQEAGRLISIINENGDEIITYAPSKTYQSVVICSAKLEKGESFDIYYGGSSSSSESKGLYENGGYSKGELLDTVEINNVVTSVGTGSGGMNFVPGGRR